MIHCISLPFLLSPYTNGTSRIISSRPIVFFSFLKRSSSLTFVKTSSNQIEMFFFEDETPEITSSAVYALPSPPEVSSRRLISRRSRRDRGIDRDGFRGTVWSGR
ncbi:hypothetical protein EUTSA_v10005174mg [Eutrema salsugineum]|uniref:Uncharacterized protein n=1 Tax=Eutrema salsugineum TaxID=72664 RepID=V4MNL8_EUTSA|nr:hypothetical protein EUTSA_v10005174mg [Eutrema salsugineum]